MAAIGVAAVSILTLFDEQQRLLELFSHFRVQYFIATVSLALIFAIARSVTWLVPMIAVTCINGFLVLPWYLGDLEEIRHGSLKILHANVQADNEDASAILQVVAAEQPDIVFLQEITDRWLADLEPLASTYPYRFAVPRSDKFGIAAYARAQPLSSRVIDSPPNGYPTLLLQIELDGRPVTLVSSHPPPPMGRAGHRTRNLQLESIAQLLAPISEPKVLIGDLNITMWSHNYAALVQSARLVDARRGFGVVPTWPMHLPIAMIPIDHCLTSPDITVADLRAGPDIGSDHRPLIVSVQAADPGPAADLPPAGF